MFTIDYFEDGEVFIFSLLLHIPIYFHELFTIHDTSAYSNVSQYNPILP